ncbi:hypothetical protein QX51_06255 [Terrisporobacter othiniensis]|uniref:PucR family transcriptional regulator n=1 Tax=Terrisporobacter othiniensis TaxID=1577792 RepID=A0A0B3VYA5_9FIRM|nr:PucR family transcriptional regulator [Terrisporobacter othiniensis]KHS57763.1 hypothetical protein QX51_06255 [Terrisporobacter othiniensis]
MSVGLKYLYNEIKKHEVKLLAGENGLKNKVRWTQLVESVEVASFLQGGELLFTTGLAMTSKDDLFNLVKKTHEMLASGIIIYIGKYIDEVDEEIINYCNENDYPVFSVSWGVEMRDTMRYLSARIIESEKNYIELSNAIKDAIFLPDHKDLFMPVFSKVGYKPNWNYYVTIIEVNSKDIDNIDLNAEMIQVTNFIDVELNYVRRNFYIKLMKEFIELEFYLGMDKKDCTLETFHNGYEASKKILQINKILRNEKSNIRFSDIDVYRLFLDMDSKENLKKFYENNLGVLEAYDNMNNTDYLKVITSYYENNCKMNETASALFIHRNTLNYKVNKIEEILDINLDDISDKSKIYLCTIIKYLL